MFKKKSQGRDVDQFLKERPLHRGEMAEGRRSCGRRRVGDQGGPRPEGFDVADGVYPVRQFEDILLLDGLRFGCGTRRRLGLGLDVVDGLGSRRRALGRGVVFGGVLRVLDIIFRDDATDGGEDLLHCRF